jgi:hypothetical protein
MKNTYSGLQLSYRKYGSYQVDTCTVLYSVPAPLPDTRPTFSIIMSGTFIQTSRIYTSFFFNNIFIAKSQKKSEVNVYSIIFNERSNACELLFCSQ